VADNERSNFLTDIIDADLEAGRHDRVVTRFPPEPNGYLHIGHAKSILLNHGIAARYNGDFNLRFDDTNPEAEKDEFVQGILEDVCWLLELDSIERVYWASDYFEQMYGFAVELVRKGLAYVDSQTPEQVRIGRGDFNTPGVESPYRNRSVDENLDLLARMRAGEFPDGAHTLRARIDMAHPNMVMRDPLLYRIKHAHHHNTGDTWCIYPMYDFAHCLEDAIEGITHSFCTLEFENNREIYDWLLDNVSAPARPHQYEFARLSLEHTVLSKRNLRRLVEEEHVEGWDDPRMPTIAGLRRRGVRASALKRFADLIGVAKANSTVDYGKFEFAVRDDLNAVAPRAFAVLDPLPVTITNLDETAATTLEAPLHPDEPDSTTRPLVLCREIFIERSDFDADPPDGWRRLSPGAVVRLRYAGLVRCDAVYATDGRVDRLECTLLDTDDVDGAGVIHWIARDDAFPAEIRLYDRLFSVPDPGSDPDVDFVTQINPDSLVIQREAMIERWLREEAIERSRIAAGTREPALRVQLERTGYFALDPSSTGDGLVFNRIVTLKDSWARQTGTDDDLDALRARKEAERAEQAARSLATRREPEDIARERGDEVLRAFIDLRNAGAAEHDALAIASAGPDAVEFTWEMGTLDPHPNETAAWFVNLTLPALKDGPVAYPPAELGALVRAVASGAISGSDAKRAHAHMLQTAKFDPEVVAPRSGAELLEIVRAVVAEHPNEVEKFRGGKTQLLGFFVGQVMRRAGGGAAAEDVRRLLSAALKGDG
jgi:glutaminyl-tRNA synthetase